MKRLFSLIGLILVAAVGTFLLIPYIVSAEAIRKSVAVRLEGLTGREVAISGLASLSVFPSMVNANCISSSVAPRAPIMPIWDSTLARNVPAFGNNSLRAFSLVSIVVVMSINSQGQADPSAAQIAKKQTLAL